MAARPFIETVHVGHPDPFAKPTPPETDQPAPQDAPAVIAPLVSEPPARGKASKNDKQDGG